MCIYTLQSNSSVVETILEILSLMLAFEAVFLKS